MPLAIGKNETRPPAVWRGWRLTGDARALQIATLLLLLGVQYTANDLAPAFYVPAITISAMIVWQALFLWGFAGRQHWRLNLFDQLASAAITGCSLALLLRTGELWLYVLAALLAVAGKFLIRIRGKHVFNPACLAIVALITLAPNQAWVSPGQWGAEGWFAALAACLAFVVLSRARSLDAALAFFVFWGLALYGRAWWLGDPWAIPAHQLQNGALLVFGFFMITDPRTLPDNRLGRILVAALVVAVAYVLRFDFYIQEHLFYALIVGNLATPLVDRLFRARPFQWRTQT